MTPTFWVGDSYKQCPTSSWQPKSGCILHARQWKFSLVSKQVWAVQLQITLPVEICLGHVIVGWQWLLILPDTTKSNMVLKVLTDTWKMLQDWNSESLQLCSIAYTRLHQYLRSLDRSQ